MESDDDRGRQILEQIADEADRGWLEARLRQPFERRARRLAERDARIRDYGVLFHPLLSGRGMATAIAVELERYARGGFRFERDGPAPADPRHGLLWRILQLSDGRNLSAGRVRAALAGTVVVAGLKSNRRQATIGSGHRGRG